MSHDALALKRGRKVIFTSRGFLLILLLHKTFHCMGSNCYLSGGQVNVDKVTTLSMFFQPTYMCAVYCTNKTFRYFFWKIGKSLNRKKEALLGVAFITNKYHMNSSIEESLVLFSTWNFHILCLCVSGSIVLKTWSLTNGLFFPVLLKKMKLLSWPT